MLDDVMFGSKSFEPLGKSSRHDVCRWDLRMRDPGHSGYSRGELIRSW